MATLTLYGSSIADTILTTACQMSSSLGGTETSVLTTIPVTSLTFAEVLSQGGTSNAVTSIPANGTGLGWVYPLGAGTFATGNWSASITLSCASQGVNATVRFFRYVSGVYTQIGQIVKTITGTAKVTYSFLPISMGTITFSNPTDVLYTDLWWFDNNANAGGDNPTLFVSNSATQGVVNDMQITTSDFTPFVPPPPVVLLAPPLPFNQAMLPVVTGASRFIYGDNL